MSKIVLGIGASHTTLMNTQWDKVDHLPAAHHFRDALGAAADRLRAARPDVVIIVGSNHFRGFWLDMMPAFTIGVDEVISSGEHGTPAGQLRSDSKAGNALCEAMLAQDFDVAFSTKLTIDHGISHAVQWITGVNGPPIVPLVINCFAPPLPSLQRCVALGNALRGAIEAIPGYCRVAIVATGGLSHQLPFPDWRAPRSDNDDFMVDSWREGRGQWIKYEARRREIIVNAPAQLNEDFDRRFLAAFEDGALKSFADALDQKMLIAQAGNGANEIRAWLIMASAMADAPGQVLAYAPMPAWLTGMAVGVIPALDDGV